MLVSLGVHFGATHRHSKQVNISNRFSRRQTNIAAPGNYSVTVGLSVYNITFQYQENAGILSIADFSDGIGEDNLQCLSGTGIVLNTMNIKIFDLNQNNK
jgi:hypothetical protein